MNMVEMANEDLMARARRDSETIAKLRCIEMRMENKLDDLTSENDQLRLLHRKAVVDIEETRAVSAEQAAKLERMTVVVDKGREGIEKVELLKDDAEEEQHQLKVKLGKAEVREGGGAKRARAKRQQERSDSKSEATARARATNLLPPQNY